MTIDREALTVLAATLGLTIPDEDVDLVRELFTSQVVPALLLQTDPLVVDAEPAATFDPRWDG